jgi:RNA polymerase sigma-70 factor (ECF subfamily)
VDGSTTGEVGAVTVPGAGSRRRHEPVLVDLDAPVDFDAFYQREHGPLVRALAVTFGDAELARDAVDEAMTRALQRWHAVGRLERPGGWVYRVAINWARSALRIRRRRRDRPLYERDGVELGVSGAAGTEPSVGRALRALDLRYRSVVVCRYLLELSEEQTAVALDLPAGTVKSRLHRGTQLLRVALAHLHDDEGSGR